MGDGNGGRTEISLPSGQIGAAVTDHFEDDEEWVVLEFNCGRALLFLLLLLLLALLSAKRDPQIGGTGTDAEEHSY